jgi:NAD+ diphosphatase
MMRYCPECAAILEICPAGGRARWCCPVCSYVHWDNPVPVVAGIVEIDGRVVIVRNREWPEHWRGIVAGFLESGETAEEGIQREVREELGLEARIVHYLGDYAFPEKNQLILAYHIEAQGEITLGEELGGYELLAPEDIRPWSKGTGQALRRWLAERLAHS